MALWPSLLCTVLSLTTLAVGYIPATPTNDTAALPDPDNANSTILLRWTDQGNYQEGINRLLEKDPDDGYGPSTGIEKGALVHFYEASSNTSSNATWDGYTITPWIAFVSCDANTTDSSEEADIFTLVRDRGAVAALLYSTTSESCTLNPDYLDPYEFEKVLDIYTTLTKSSARLIESQFTNVNKTDHYFFNAPRLNESYNAVESAIMGNGVEDGYLIATVKMSDVPDPDPGTTNGTTVTPVPSSSGGSSTGLAMIILYAITGCVSALFCIVIITGAIRALRHPERYGPRMGDPNLDGFEGEPQTRAAGLTRAILDTFPVVKFGRGNTAGESQTRSGTVYGKYSDGDVESVRDKANKRTSGMSATAVPVAEEHEMVTSPGHADHTTARTELTDADGAPPAATVSGPVPPQQRKSDEPTQEMIGTEICPICITDFEEGDDLRVLPCEGKHKFHRDCVDPWLLQVSSLCPLCREDFIALENMATGNAPPSQASSQSDLHAPNQPRQRRPSSSSSPGVSRFSRYLRVAQRQRRRGTPSIHDSEAAGPSRETS